MDAIPPTKAALVYTRAIFQGGHCWDKMLSSQQNLQLYLKPVANPGNY